MPKVVRINPNQYQTIIRYRESPDQPMEFSLKVFYHDTVINELDELPNIAYRLFDTDPDKPPVFVRLDIHANKWFDKTNYNTLRRLLADLLLEAGIDIGATEYPNGLLEYLNEQQRTVEVDLKTGVILYTVGCYRLVFKPLADHTTELYTKSSIIAQIGTVSYLLVDDTRSAWTSFLATSNPKWFRDNRSFMEAVRRAFIRDTKGTVLQDVNFTS